MKKNLLILGTVSLAAFAAVGALSFRGTPSFVHATDNLGISLTVDNVKNIGGNSTDGYTFDLSTTTTFSNEYAITGVYIYGGAAGTHVYSKTNPHTDGRMLDMSVSGDYAYMQITQSFSNVTINSVDILASIDGGEKQTLDSYVSIDNNQANWYLWLYADAYGGSNDFSTIAIYEINISYNCQIM